MVAPLINHTALLPSVFLSKRSALASPSKSATAAILEPLSNGGRLTVETAAPFRSHMMFVPLRFLNRISALPSPSKSAAAPTLQFLSRDGSVTVEVTVAPFKSQTRLAPSKFLLQKISD